MNIDSLSVQWTKLLIGHDGAALNRRVALGAAAVCVVALGYQIVKFVAVVTSTEAVVAPPPMAAQQAARSASSLDGLLGAHLFGEAQQQVTSPVPVPADAPDTTLNLALTGILFGAKDSDRRAIVADGRRAERSYRIGQEIGDTQGATVYAVLADRVLLRRGTAFETLRLPRDTRPSNSIATVRQAETVASHSAGEPSPGLGAAPTRRNPAVRLVRSVRDGAFVGFGVLPGKDRGAFQALGLAPNDVVTHVNGEALDGPTKEAVLADALGKSGSVSLKILRGGVDQALTVDVSPGGDVRQP